MKIRMRTHFLVVPISAWVRALHFRYCSCGPGKYGRIWLLGIAAAVPAIFTGHSVVDPLVGPVIPKSHRRRRRSSSAVAPGSSPSSPPIVPWGRRRGRAQGETAGEAGGGGKQTTISRGNENSAATSFSIPRHCLVVEKLLSRPF
ncbi:hypothetical protein PUN28_006392 [Cardiocondyla obscurior]|uniref:Uncharacterized protein n=1 Tax=Cardiocondyla obscurior TaxID=286306 RepID=A0AAW2G8F3_9HYME